MVAAPAATATPAGNQGAPAGVAQRYRDPDGRFSFDLPAGWTKEASFSGESIVVFVAPRARPLVAGAVALGLCWAIEFAQLTAVPATLSAHGTVLRMVFGTTFHRADLFWYAVGIAPLLALHLAVVSRPARRR